jgi:ActR/RegA family two-component response regulator
MERLGAILVLDDDRDVLQAAELALAAHAARVVTGQSPEEIAPALAEARFDCVLLDMNFVAGQRSGGEGFEALAAIKAADPTLSVVLMTAYGAVALAVESLKRGADDFLLKPWRNDGRAGAGAAQGQYRPGGRRAGAEPPRPVPQDREAWPPGQLSRATFPLWLRRPAGGSFSLRCWWRAASCFGRLSATQAR